MMMMMIFLFLCHNTLGVNEVKLSPKMASQSQTQRGFIDFVANRAIDNQLHRCSLTTIIPPRWWEVKLNERKNLTRVLIFNEEDNNNLEVELSTSFITQGFRQYKKSIINDQEWIEYCLLHKTVGAVDTIKIKDLRNDSNVRLKLCEVKIFERKEEKIFTREDQQSSASSSVTRFLFVFLQLCATVPEIFY